MIRKKDILALKPAPVTGMGGQVSARALGDLLILFCYQDRELIGRWCMDTETGRYLARMEDTGEWGEKKLMSIYDFDPNCYSRYSWHREDGGVIFDTKESEETVRRTLGKWNTWEKDAFRLIGYCEEQYRSDQRERAEERRQERLERQMGSVPSLPPGLREWLRKVTGGEDYLFRAKGGKGRWYCTSCGATLEERQLGAGETEEGSVLVCGNCKKEIRCMGRKRTVRRQTHCVLLQDMGENESVARHIDVRITWDNTGRRAELSEGVRIVMYRKYKKRACEIYYAKRCMTDWMMTTEFSRTNEANRKMVPGYLYPEGISGALAGTRYAVWTRVFRETSVKGLCMNYSLAMLAAGDKAFASTCEYLIKGRFFRLTAESMGRVSLYYGNYKGFLDKYGMTIEEVFGIRDRQKINRIRDMDGGELMVEWMRFSDLHEKKLSQRFLAWAQENGLRPKDLEAAGDITPEQAMNYINRQTAESYPGKNRRQTLEQWMDYLDMCGRLEKDLKDPMISRPRELKRRHDEAVEELNRVRILEDMRKNEEWAERMEQEMRKKYPGAEENLQEIREKFEYESGGYRIIVPGRLSEIALEGNALHHCAGSSERYYERIMRHETYICFLRRADDPDTPYYTIEVEPGGTIRQHRSLYDLEPGIEEIRGFLKEWQREIQKRMKAEDHRRAGLSRRLREDNIRQLKEANNTRVLKGLMEDFMAAETETRELTEAI